VNFRYNFNHRKKKRGYKRERSNPWVSKSYEALTRGSQNKKSEYEAERKKNKRMADKPFVHGHEKKKASRSLSHF
jgi:hypothetical protein